MLAVKRADLNRCLHSSTAIVDLSHADLSHCSPGFCGSMRVGVASQFWLGSGRVYQSIPPEQEAARWIQRLKKGFVVVKHCERTKGHDWFMSTIFSLPVVLVEWCLQIWGILPSKTHLPASKALQAAEATMGLGTAIEKVSISMS